MPRQSETPRIATAKECALRGFGACSGKISGEHYISASLLREISADGRIFIQGTPWAASGPLRVGIPGLTANIICEGHNSRLSKLDSHALRFFKSIKTAQLALQAGNNKSQTHTFDSLLLERWFLKVLYMMWSSGNLARDGQRIEGAPPDVWGEYLLGIREMPENWGLYVKPIDSPFATSENEFELVSLSGDDGSGLKGGHFKLGRLPFSLVLGQPGGEWGIHRPARVILQQNNTYHQLRLNWPGHAAGEDIIYTRIEDAE